MRAANIFLVSIAVMAVSLFATPVLADSGQNALYQTNFATNPRWTTNNPSLDYWDASREMYHFSIAPGTGNYAYSPAIDYEGGSFTLDYDVLIESINESATFRLGFSGTEMDIGKSPNLITSFADTKGQIMGLRIITPSSKLIEVTSATSSYGGPTVNYATNTPYHVKVVYNDDTDMVTMTVTNKATGTQIWSYFLSTSERLKGMNRIYIGSVGDYGDGSTNKFATGWIDNIQLISTSSSGAVTTTPTTIPPTTQPTFSLKPTTKPTTVVPLTSIPTPTKKSPGFGGIAVVGLALMGAWAVLNQDRRKQ